MKYYYLHLDAGQDANGNPQRLFLVFDENGLTVDAIDEEYTGDRVSKRYFKAIHLGRIKTTKSEYYNLLKQFEKR